MDVSQLHPTGAQALWVGLRLLKTRLRLEKRPETGKKLSIQKIRLIFNGYPVECEAYSTGAV